MTRQIVTDLGNLLAATPALLGAWPGDGVLILNGVDAQGVVLLAIAIDLPTSESTLQTIIERTARILSRNGIHAVHAALIDSDPGARPYPQVEVIEQLTEQLNRRLIDVYTAIAADRLAAGAVWHSLLDDEHGTIADPATSPAACAVAADGRRIHRSREAMAQQLAPDEDTRRRVAASLPALDVEPDRAVRLDLILGHLRHPAKVPAVRCMAAMAEALCDIAVRDALIPVTLDFPAAERLWARLCRSLPDPYRSNVALLVGVGAYWRGDGIYARIALTIARDSDPDNELAGLLTDALRLGLHPRDVLPLLADTGRSIAAELGVSLPSPPPSPSSDAGDIVVTADENP